VIAYLEGKINYKAPTNIHLDIGGIAYDVQISLNTFAEIEQLDRVKLYTHLIIRDDAHSIYGFFTMSEKDLFGKLISVSGIGPNTARVILSYMTPNEAKSAILTDNVVAFKKVKGVGPKTAQRVILDLKDKVAKEGLELESVNMPDSSLRDEALSALLALGFNKNIVGKQLDKVLKVNPDVTQVENLIKAVLRQLS